MATDGHSITPKDHATASNTTLSGEQVAPKTALYGSTCFHLRTRLSAHCTRVVGVGTATRGRVASWLAEKGHT